MKEILFVEDEAILLKLYSLMLQTDPPRWHCTLAANGEAALALVKKNRFDIVISDLHMPGMGGIELLTQVRQLHPETSRIVISGFTDQAEAAESLNCTHLFLPKPFEAKFLRDTLARIGSLDAYLQSDALRALASQLPTLPSFPTLYLDLMREIESPTASIQSIAALAGKDPGITAKILQVANSAALALPEKISDPAEAVQHLGAATVRSIALSAHVFRSLAQGHSTTFSPEVLWNHLMQCGQLARAIMRHEHADTTGQEDAFTAGLLHDIGKLMLAESLPEKFNQALALAARDRRPLHEAEMKIFGATHAGLAAYLLGLWGLPTAMVEAVAFHHQPRQSELKKFSPLTAVHVANVLCNHADPTPVDEDYLAGLGLLDHLAGWRQLAAEP